MINKNIIISIGILIILSVLFDRFLRKTQLSSVLNENFEVNNTNVDPGPKYSPSGESYVDYSVDFNNFKLRLANGYFKINNVGDAFLSYIGLLTIVITKNDYRDNPFDTIENIDNCLRKWTHFKYDGKFYKFITPEKNTEEGFVTIYRHFEYGDPNAQFSSGEYNRSALEDRGLPNDSISAFDIPEGFELILYKHVNFDTELGRFTGPKKSTLKSTNYDNQVSSLKVNWLKTEIEYIKEDDNGTITIEIQFESVEDDEPVSFKNELILSELSFYIGPYENANEFTEERATEYATDLLSKLGEINNGVACGWHYNEETGGAAGYFSEILNDVEWQNKNPELYTSLSSFICPSYMPVCTGQRRTGIVPGKCITLKDNCNNGIVDNMMGIERPPWDTTKIVDTEGIISASIIKKNIANREALKSTIDKLSYVLDEPSIETFQNEEDEEETCKFHIENKCYDQYVEVDKKYYDTGANIFNNIFPTTDQNVFKKICYDITHWISKNIVYLLSYKFIVGGLAALLYWSVNPHLDFQIRVFKSFIAFVFCEIYLLYNVYKHILKPTITERIPVLA